MKGSLNPTELTKELFGSEFFKDITKKLEDTSEADISREVEKSANQLNLVLSQLVLSRLPILQKMIDFMGKFETKMFSEDMFDLCLAKFYDKEGKEVEVFDAEGKKMSTVYDMDKMRIFYEKVNKDFLNALEFMRKYTSRIPLDGGAEMTHREKEIMRVLSSMSEDELSEMSRVIYERNTKKVAK